MPESSLPAAASSPAARPALWSRGFLLACLANIMMFFNVHFLLSTVAGYTVARFAVGDSVGGAVASVFILGTLISRVLAGPLIERFGSRPLLLIGFAAFVAAPLLYWASGSVWMLLLVRAVHGLTFGVSSSVIAGAAVNRLPAARLSEGTSHYSSSTLIGVAAGPLVGLALAGSAAGAGVGGGFGPIAVIASAVSLLGLVTAWFMDVRPRRSNPATSASPAASAAAAAPRPGWARYAEPGAVPTAAVASLYSLGYAGIVTFLATLAADRGFGAVASLFFAVYAGTVLVSRLFTGRLMERRGANVVMLPAFVLFAAGLAAIAAADHVWLLLTAAVLVGLGYGQLLSAGQVICVTRVPREHAGMGASTYFLGIDLGMGIGPLLAGVLVQWWGTAGMFWALSGFILVLLPVFWQVQGRQLHRQERP